MRMDTDLNCVYLYTSVVKNFVYVLAAAGDNEHYPDY